MTQESENSLLSAYNPSLSEDPRNAVYLSGVCVISHLLPPDMASVFPRKAKRPFISSCTGTDGFCVVAGGGREVGYGWNGGSSLKSCVGQGEIKTADRLKRLDYQNRSLQANR